VWCSNEDYEQDNTDSAVDTIVKPDRLKMVACARQRLGSNRSEGPIDHTKLRSDSLIS
jgi:hypothetical protein